MKPFSLFSIPKPFNGHVGIIQRNAITSWTLLRPRPDIILFGGEEDTAPVAKAFGIHQDKNVACNEFGTPLIGDVFEKAQRLTGNPIICYSNADIIFMQDLALAIEQVSRRMKRFLLTGRRWNVEANPVSDFDSNWEARLQRYVRENGRLYSPEGMDYFVFPHGALGDIPAFAVGRAGWDNWVIYRARALRMPVIDATDMVMAVHQNHDYSHISKMSGDGWTGIEAERNRGLAGGWRYIFTLNDATHRLTPSGLKAAIQCRCLIRRIKTLPELYPNMPFIVPMLRTMRKTSKCARRLLGGLRHWMYGILGKQMK